MWDAAFSSNSVLQNVTPLRPTREVSSTSATSPSSDGARRRARPRLEPRRRRSTPSTLVIRPVRERHLEVRDDRAADQHERLRRAHRALGPAPVGCREDLLGRQVRHVEAAPGGLRSRPPSSATAAAARRSGRSRARGSEPRRRRRSFSCAARSCSTATCVGPGGHRVGLVQPDGRPDRVPEPRDVRLAEDLLRPARRREGDDRPRHPPWSKASQ